MLSSLPLATDKQIIESLETEIVYQNKIMSLLKREAAEQEAIIKSLKQNCLSSLKNNYL